MDLKAITDEQLEQYRMDVLTEQERRQRLATTPQQVTQIAQAYVADGGDLSTLTQAVTAAETRFI